MTRAGAAAARHRSAAAAPPTFLWVGLAVLIPLVALVVLSSLVVHAMGWRAL